jgi:integrase
VMEIMPRPRPPYLNRVVTRHGRVVWVVRVGHGDQRRRVRIKAEYGTPEFRAEYEAALSDADGHLRRAAASSGTLGWLIERYCETALWTNLSLATRRRREAFFKAALATAGDVPLARITKDSIIAGRDRRAATPGQAFNFLVTMRGLFQWAVDARHIKEDPTLGVRKVQLPRTGGFPIWTEEHVAAYEMRWPVGTRQRVWLDVLLYTGLRRGDAVRLGRQHVKTGVATIITGKTGTEVTIPILKVLADTLNAGPCGDLAFIVGPSGRPMTKESFGHAFHKACRAAGVPGSAHGLRKIAATRAANAGATVAQLQAIFGWTSDRMASLYTRAADRRRLAREAIHKLMGD